ncbi:MAG: peptidoglycan DD-metalloendopeptidase family protein [Caldilineales bacterium]|nr:peptidoglycan DD-metalloendopeptidase family protein [Caldilineales bacterium]
MWQRRLLVWVLLGGLLLTGPGTAAAEAPGPRVHIVVAGDTLSALAQRYGVTVEAIAAANRLADPNRIVVGQRLLIPTGENPRTTSATATAITYVLQPGDTLPALARRWQVSPADILRANGVTRASALLTEPEIVIPLPTRSALPAPFVQVEATENIIQGQTGVVFVTLSRSEADLRGRFGDVPLVFARERRTPDGQRFWALLPTTAITRTGEYALTVWSGDGQVVRTVAVLPGAYETQHIVLPPGKGDLLAPGRTRPELERLLGIWGAVSPTPQWQGRFRFPIADGFRQTSPYGTKRSYNGGPVSSFHAGTDWGAPEGTPVWAPAHGTVVLAEMLDVRGGAVIIDHGLGVTSNFWHLSRIDVRPGDRVAPGDVIGLVGTTGLSTAAHLHWELRVGTLAVDPLQWTETHFPYLR